MKTTIALCLTAFVAASVYAADSAKDEVLDAAKKLGDQSNYSWTTTVKVPEGSQYRPGPAEGKTEKDGFTYLESKFRDTTMKTVVKGGKGAVTNQDGEWEGLADAEKAEGFGRFRAIMARSLQPPAVQAADLAKGAKSLSKEGDAYSGDLTEDAAKNLLTFRRGAGGGDRNVSGAKGSIKFWLKDGELSKYEYKVQGTVSFNGNDREIDRTTTVEIKDVGTTKLTVPDEAKNKLS